MHILTGRRTPLLRALAGCCFLVPWIGGCGAPESPSVLLIVIDTLRADRVGALGDPRAFTPTLDGLAARGLLFSDANTPVPVTLPAVTSLMTGLEPPAHRVRDNGVFALDDSTETLAERFSRAGYRTGAVIGSAVLASDRGLDRGFDHYDASFRGPYPVYDSALEPYAAEFAGNRRRADRVTRLAMDRIRQWDHDPFFLTVHYFDAHMHYDPPPSYAGRHSGRPYDAEITFLDFEIGRLLRSLPDPEGTLIIVVADHGESQGEHGEPQHGFLLYQSTLSVPFLVSGPGIPRGVRAEPVSLIDVEPTLGAHLTLPGGSGPRDGHVLSWRQPIASPDAWDRTLYAETMHTLVSNGWRELRALRNANRKVIRSPEERYDLDADPREMVADLLSSPAFRELAAELDARIAADATPTEILALARNAPDAQSRELLESLGYLSQTEPTDPVERVHPREQLPRWIARQESRMVLRRAAAWLAEGRARSADSLAAHVLERNPDAMDAMAFRGYVAEQQRESDAAARWYEQVIARQPEHLQSNRGLARISQARGHDLEALRFWKVVADQDTTDLTALRSVSLGLLRGEQPARARRYLERLLRADPTDPTTLYNLALACEADGDRESAERHLQDFVERAPHDPEAAKVRGRLETGSWGES